MKLIGFALILLFQSGAWADQANVRLAKAARLEEAGFLVAAFDEYAPLIRGGGTTLPYFRAVEASVRVQQQLGDEYLIPTFLSREANEEGPMLSRGTLSYLHYLKAVVRQRKGDLDRAKVLLESVSLDSRMYSKAQYLLGVIKADPRWIGDPQSKSMQSIAHFRQVLNLNIPNQSDSDQIKPLAALGLGRVYYGLKRYPEAISAYKKIARFSPFWEQALFEESFAKFQGDDVGGALGLLQTLHAPQYLGAFQPESWILKGTLYHLQCLYDESRVSLDVFDRTYLPINKVISDLLEHSKDPSISLLGWTEREDQSPLPKPLFLWVAHNRRIEYVKRTLAEVDRERSALGSDFQEDLKANREVLNQVGNQLVKNRLVEAQQMIKNLANQGDIIRFESSKAEKNILEAHRDQSTILNQQTLKRPEVPGQDWNYWKFQGEFWLDEMGYYQYAVKNGCPRH